MFDVVTLGRWPSHDVLRFAAAVEARSEHPVARAIVAHAHTAGLDLPPVSSFVSVPGMGAEAEVDGMSVVVGNARLFHSRGMAIPDDALLDEARRGGTSLVFVSVDGSPAAALAMADRPRDTAREAIQLLREHGIRWVAMLTGDHERAAARVAEELQLDEYHAGLLPDQKYALVRSLLVGFAISLVGGVAIGERGESIGHGVGRISSAPGMGRC